jgi:hypothetical protein
MSLIKYPHTDTPIIPRANVAWNKIPQTERFEGPTNSVAKKLILIGTVK